MASTRTPTARGRSNPDGVFPYVGRLWSYTPSAYGPVFTVFSYLLAPLTIATSAFAYKSIAVVVQPRRWWRWCGSCAKLRDKDPVRAAALVGLNPLLVIYGVGGGHNDLLMLLAMIGGLYAVLASREWVGGGAEPARHRRQADRRARPPLRARRRRPRRSRQGPPRRALRSARASGSPGSPR